MKITSTKIIIFGSNIISLICLLSFLKLGLQVKLLKNNNKKDSKKNKIFYTISDSNKKFLNYLCCIREFYEVIKLKIYKIKIYGSKNCYFDFNIFNINYISVAWIIKSSELKNILEKNLNKNNTNLVIQKVYCLKNGYLIFKNKNLLKYFLIIITDDKFLKLNNIIYHKFYRKYYQEKSIALNIYIQYLSKNTVFQWFFNNGVLAVLSINKMDFFYNILVILSIDISYASKIDNLNLVNKCKILEHIIRKITKNKLGILKIQNYIGEYFLQANQANSLYNNIVFIGECYHKVHPLAGQGLNIGIEDVRLLIKIFKKARKKFFFKIGYIISIFFLERNNKINDIRLIINILNKIFKEKNFPNLLIFNYFISIINNFCIIKKIMYNKVC